LRFILFISFILLQLGVFANVDLPDALSDHMVLQQNTKVKLWGKANKKKLVKISVSWSKRTYYVRVDKDGNWKVLIQTPKGSFTKHTITFKEGLTHKLEDVLIGEVWFCSGQSNMEMPLRGFKDQPIEGADSVIKNVDSELGIRMLTVKRNPQETPVESCEGKWQVPGKLNIAGMSATAYFFANRLREQLNVPIGIINSSWGGSSVEGWMTRTLVEKYSDLDLSKEYSANETWKKPWIMYNGMLHPLRNFTIKGFCWYQGESNTDRYETYQQKLTEMIALWRSEWNLGDLPFLLVEIAPYNYENGLNAAHLRTAQFNCAKLNTNVGIIGTNDLVTENELNNIHPPRKKEVGERLANYALMETYQLSSIQARSPAFASYLFIENAIVLYFTNLYDGIQPMEYYSGFEIAGEDDIFYPAKATLNEDRKTLRVEAPEVTKPTAVRYCYKNFQLGNVKNSVRLPLLGFSAATGTAKAE
jgi:sialate O-acetylesterase